MREPRVKGRLAVVVPTVAGLGLLGIGLWLLPGDREVVTAARRARPAPAGTSVLPPPTTTSAPVPVAVVPQEPALAAAILTEDAASLATLTARLIANGRPVTTLQVAYDLVAANRPAVALDYLAARPDGQSAASWRLRFDLLHKAGRSAEATALLTAAAARRGVGAADIVAAGYALDRPDLIVAAAASGAIPSPDAALALDLARRAERLKRYDLIAALDRSTRVDWRAGDPWLALRLAQRSGDEAAALRAVANLPAGQRAAAREAILNTAGDRAGLRALLLAREPSETTAEQLLAAGYRDDAIAVLRRVANGLPIAARPTQRLLYLLGPRPAASDVIWLRQRTVQGSADEQMRWLAVYAERVSPAEALATLSRHPLANRTDAALLRLSLANAAGDSGAGRTAIAALLDGRPLDAAQLRRLSGALPRRIDPDQAAAITRLRVAAGIAGPSDRMDLAWAAWNAGDAKTAARWLREQLAARPADLAALRLMADVQIRLGQPAKPWLERALEQTPPASRARAELLDRLGRHSEAVALVETLRQAAPADRSLVALHARLLIAQGRPGAARTVLAQ